MTTYYKAVRPDGTDFRTGTIDYLAGGVIEHPKPIPGSPDAKGYLSVSTSITYFPGASWPWRLLEVEPVGETWVPGYYPYKVAVSGLRVVREIEAHESFGPQGKHVVAFIERAQKLTRDEAYAIRVAYCADDYAAATTRRVAADGAIATYAAAYAAADAAYAAGAAAYAASATTDAAYYVATAASDAVAGLSIRNLIGKYGFTQEHYDLLTGPWRRTIGRIHPDDADMKED